MLTFPPAVKVFVATQPVDGRKGAYSLAAMVRSVFHHDPFVGNLYVFFTRRLDRVRVLYWDRNGFALWTKRLEKGRFRAVMSADLSARQIRRARPRSRRSRPVRSATPRPVGTAEVAQAKVLARVG